MKNSLRTNLLTAGLVFSVVAAATATQLTSDFVPKYRVDQPTTFDVTNIGATDYVLTWVDGGVTNSAQDPELVLSVGVEYVFARNSSFHPFGILSGDMPTAVNGDFSLRRDTSSPNDFLLANSAQLSGNPASQPNSVTWTPQQAGEYYYTCMVTSHPNMTGRFLVVDPPAPTTPVVADLVVIGDFAALLVTNVVADQVLLIQTAESLDDSSFVTAEAVLVDSALQELFVPGLTNRSGFFRAVVE